MKNNKKKIIIIASVILVAILGIFFALYLLKDKDQLTVIERNWVNKNNNIVLNLNVINDTNIFGKDGTGVFYSFISDFSKEFGLTINPITYKYGDSKSGVSFALKNEVNDKDLVFYTDHYVLVSKSDEVIVSNESLSGKNIAVLSSDMPYISPYLNTSLITFKQYETRNELLSAFKDNNTYMIVPLDYYMDEILTNNYNIVYHFSDIKSYYVLSLIDDDTLSSVLEKYFHKWNNFNTYYNEEEFALFVSKLGITDTEVDAIRSVDYNYGFVNASPYEVIKGGSYGGIVAVTLKEFSDFSKVEFNFVNYKNYSKFLNASKDGDIDLFFDRYNSTDEFKETSNVFSISYSIIANRKNDIAINSLNSLRGKTVYVEENSVLFDYLKSNLGITVKTYNGEKGLAKLNKKNVIIVLDSRIYNYYSSKELDNYTERYTNDTNDTNKAYTFKVQKETALFKLLDKYVSSLDKNVIINKGLANHHKTISNGNLLGSIAQYVIYIVLIGIVVILLAIKKTRKITIARKIRRDDKLKFIDQLTSLKNRNYLNECLETWNNNTIYPQTIIVVDLNGIQEINDINGYSEGDKQIKACANILIKTQLDNSEIMRTDGNEFVIYLVGYSAKQVTNYIHKLNKEVNKLPYKNGAEFGYSMIDNDIKTIEDALNEAVEEMKKQKKDIKNEKTSEKA